MNYRVAHIYVEEEWAGILEETEQGYRFQYREQYLKKEKATPVSLTLPLQDQPYESNVLFPFFDGLIPEGWILNVVEQSWKVTPGDRMGLLLVSCRETIGDVSVREPEDNQVQSSEEKKTWYDE